MATLDFAVQLHRGCAARAIRADASDDGHHRVRTHQRSRLDECAQGVDVHLARRAERWIRRLHRMRHGNFHGGERKLWQVAGHGG
jgi:hypothetical protein